MVKKKKSEYEKNVSAQVYAYVFECEHSNLYKRDTAYCQCLYLWVCSFISKPDFCSEMVTH